MIKALFFDLDGVVFFIDWVALNRGFASRLGLAENKISAARLENEHKLVLGEMNFPEYLVTTGHVGDARVAEKIWLEEALNATRVNKEVIDLLIELRGKYKLQVITNLSENRYGLDIKLDIYKYFDHATLSFMEHLKKPDPEIYKLALQRSNVNPEETIFIDDAEKNVLGAQAVGMHGIKFDNNPRLFEELKKFGIDLAKNL